MSGHRCSANSIFNRWHVFEPKVIMTNQEIKAITDRVHAPCLYGGIHTFSEDVQQYTCKDIQELHGGKCGCYDKFLEALTPIPLKK